MFRVICPKLVRCKEKAKSAFGRLKKRVWSRRDLSVKLKLHLYEALILPIAIHCSETWSLTQLYTKQLSVFENNFLRAVLNIRLQDHVSIDQIRKSAKQQKSIENSRLTQFGHVCRINDKSLLKQMKDFYIKRNR